MSDATVTTPSPVEVRPAYEVVVNRLRRWIHLGIYQPGDKLPPERLHAEQLGVSRVTLREAIRVLEGEGHVEVRRGSAGGVLVLSQSESAGHTRARLRDRIVEVEGILDFRLANERAAAERAATRIVRSELTDLETSISAMEATTEASEFRRADSRFHLAIAKAAACELLRQAVEDGRVAMFMPIDVIDYEVMKQSSVRHHRAILAALKAKDVSRAGRAMATHIEVTRDEIRAVVELPEGSPHVGSK